MSTQIAISDNTPPADAPPGFHQLAKPGGSACNINCTYCFFRPRRCLHPKEKSRMYEATRLRGRDD